jgi:hypothetical protein
VSSASTFSQASALQTHRRADNVELALDESEDRDDEFDSVTEGSVEETTYRARRGCQRAEPGTVEGLENARRRRGARPYRAGREGSPKVSPTCRTARQLATRRFGRVQVDSGLTRRAISSVANPSKAARGTMAKKDMTKVMVAVRSRGTCQLRLLQSRSKRRAHGVDR